MIPYKFIFKLYFSS